MKNPILILAVAVAVKLCSGYSIKEPGPYSASFSGSSSSSSAYSHASSSSYTYNGNLQPHQIEGLKEALKAGAIASANAGAGAGSGAVAGAIAGVGTGALAGAGAQATSGATGDSSGGANAASGSTIGTSGSSGCSGSTCGSQPSSNTIGDFSASSGGTGGYKVIGSDKYTTGYNSGSKTNYAVSGNYAQGGTDTGEWNDRQKTNLAGGCASCKGPFPGPNGNIHDSKLASSVPHAGNAPSVHPIQPAAGSFFYHQKPITIVPGAPSNIYGNQPTTGHIAPSTTYYNTGSGYGSGHVSPSLIAKLPGSPGSIYDSKPASAAGSGSYASGGNHGYVIPSQPIPTPSCSHIPGSPNKNCGGTPVVVGPGLTQIIATFPGPTGSILEGKPVGLIHGVGSGSAAGSGASSGSHSAAGSVTNIPSSHPVVGPVCSYTPGSPNKCGSVAGAGANANAGVSSGSSSGSGSITNIPSSHPVVGPACSYTPGSPNKCGANANAASQAAVGVLTPSIHPQIPSSGIYYVNKYPHPVLDLEPPLISPTPSFSGQIPCADRSCGSIPKTPVSQPANCAPGSGCGGQTGSISGSYAGAQSSAGSGIVYVDKDTSGQHTNLNHDAAHLSGGIVYENGDGSYVKTPTTSKTTYKNAAQGGYAVSSDNADNTGFLIGPGTGHLPIESDAHSKPFGTQGAFGGSAAFSETPSYSGKTYDVNIEKSDGIQVKPVTEYTDKPACSTGTCDSGSNSFAGSNTNSFTGSGSTSFAGSGSINGQVNKAPAGAPVKLACTGASCGDTEVFVIEDKPSPKPGSYGSNFGSGSGSDSGFATGQVLLNQGGNTYDVTNSGSKGVGSAYSGAYPHFGPTGCSTGQCGAQGVGLGGSFAIPSPGGFLDKLFGAGGLSGTGLNRIGGGHGGSGAYSSAGSYAGASAGSFASAGASASARAASFSGSY